MKSFVALTYLALLAGAPLLSVSQASAEKAHFDPPFDRHDSSFDRYDDPFDRYDPFDRHDDHFGRFDPRRLMAQTTSE